MPWAGMGAPCTLSYASDSDVARICQRGGAIARGEQWRS